MKKLESIWPPADGVKLLIEENILDDTTIDKLVTVLENAAKQAVSDEHKVKFEKAAQTLAKLNHLELTSKHNDQVEIQQLEEMLENM